MVPEKTIISRRLVLLFTMIVHGMHVNTLAGLTATASEEKIWSSAYSTVLGASETRRKLQGWYLVWGPYEVPASETRRKPIGKIFTCLGYLSHLVYHQPIACWDHAFRPGYIVDILSWNVMMSWVMHKGFMQIWRPWRFPLRQRMPEQSQTCSPNSLVQCRLDLGYWSFSGWMGNHLSN